jgi:hypothetical protein
MSRYYSIEEEKTVWGFLPSPVTRPSFFQTVMPAGSRFGTRELEAIRASTPQINQTVQAFSGGNAQLINQLARQVFQTPVTVQGVQPAQVSFYQPPPPPPVTSNTSLENTVRSIINTVLTNVTNAVSNPFSVAPPVTAPSVALPPVPQVNEIAGFPQVVAFEPVTPVPTYQPEPQYMTPPEPTYFAPDNFGYDPGLGGPATFLYDNAMSAY